MLAVDDDIDLAGAGVTAWVLDHLTDAGRVPFGLAVRSLTAWEAAVVDHLLGCPDVALRDRPAEPGVCVTTSTLRRLSLWRADESRPAAERVLGWLAVPQSLLDMVDEQVATDELRESVELARLTGTLREWERAGELPHRVWQLTDWVERVETVFILIGRDVFSKSDAGSNTLTRDGLLAGLLDRPVDEWRPADRLFVVAAHCLFRTGRSVRLEEFNGIQLTATRLRDFLFDRYVSYCACAGTDPGPGLGGSVFDLAERIRAVMPRVDASSYLRYRRVNGLSFVKNEHLLPFPRPYRDPTRLPDLVAGYGHAVLGLRPEAAPGRAAMRALTEAAVEADLRSGDSTAMQGLLASVVLSAVERTGSDYGMSSGIRDLRRLRGAEPAGVDGVLSLAKPDFFCCCVPGRDRMLDLPDDERVAILWRAAQRMMYNRWHFVPGELAREQVPAGRHYFFPPQVPDIAEHADHRHGGHRASRVRYSIRAPGPQVWHPPLTVFGNDFRGCYDIRLVRMTGPPFTISELLEAVRHCSLVDELWRTLAERVRSEDRAARPVEGFGRDWYQSRTWEDLQPWAAVPATDA